MRCRLWSYLLVLLALASLSLPAVAGSLWKQDIERMVGSDYVVGEIQSDLPVYPLYLANPAEPDAKPELKAYAFETNDLTSVRGYSGKPINILVVMDLHGGFLAAQLLEQKEPLFVRDDDVAKLHRYTKQHLGLSLRHTIEVGKPNDTPSRSEQAAHLRGIHTGTITAKAITRTIVSAAANVALARLKLAGITPDNGKTSAPAALPPATLQSSVPTEPAKPVHADKADKVEKAEKAEKAEKLDKSADPAGSSPSGKSTTTASPVPPPAISITTLVTSPPRIMQFNPPGKPAAGKARTAAGSAAPAGGGTGSATGSTTAAASAAGAPSGTAANAGNAATAAPSTPPTANTTAPAAAAAASAVTSTTAAQTASTTTGTPANAVATTGATPADAADATGAASATALDGTPDAVTEAVPDPALDAAPAPPALSALELQAADDPDWLSQWQDRYTDIAILLAGLAILTIALIAQRRFSASPRRLRVLRTLYLLFTVGFIGWYAQGQLSIVNITAAIESLSSGGDLSFLMNDPMMVILWVFVGLTLLVWGRGTFCGWLCPFGALQELISLVANAIGVRQRRLRAALDARLKWIKYGVLAAIIGAVFIAPDAASWMVEVEPFKTAISLYFVRSWPFVLWAVACLALTVFIYRGYCRYICPLGAALASLGFLRRWSWIARRTECGTPCQSCRHRCEYQAIEQSGKINYRECFQCLDCVSIYQDEHRCMPLIVEKKRTAKVIPVRELVSESP